MTLSNTNPAALDLFCPECGYNLRGTTSERCPECGLALDRATLSVSSIPWAHRHRIGRVRAYAKTVWLVFRRPTLVGREVSKPQSWRDAVMFRRVTTAVVFLALLVTMAVVVVFEFKGDMTFSLLNGLQNPIAFNTPSRLQTAFWTDFAIVAMAGWEMWFLAPLFVFPLCMAWTGLAGYFFHPRSLTTEQQNRAVALSCYTAAPLVGLWIFLALGLLLAVIVNEASPPDFEWRVAIQGITLIGVGIAIAVAWGWWIGTLKILRVSTHASAQRVTVAAAVLPSLWLVAAGVCLYLLPSLLGFFALVVSSLQ